MANYKGAMTITMPVARTTVLAQYRFVGVDSNGELGYPAANAEPVGVTAMGSTATSDVALTVYTRNGGVVKVECDSSTIAAGAKVTFEATTGKVTTTGVSDDNKVGLALETGADGKIIQVALT